MIVRLFVSAVCLVTSVVAQAPAADASVENLFYRAFYLHRAERRHEAALELYREFLAKAPKHEHAGRALEAATGLLEEAGKADAAAELRARFAPPERGPAQRGAPVGAPGGPPRPGGEVDGERLSDEDIAALRERVGVIRAQLAAFEAAGDERGVRRLKRQIERAERQIRTGVAPAGGDRGGRGDRGGDRRRGGLALDFSSMSADEMRAGLEQIAQFQERIVERMRDRGQDDRADELEERYAALQKAVEAGDQEKAQEVFDEMMESMRRRR